jgi:hypothetical protein
MINMQKILLLQTSLSGIALLGFIFAIRWLIFSTHIFSDFDDLRDEFKNRSKDTDGETMTELIIQNMAFYRQNKSAIEKLALGSRITGIFFLLSGMLAVYNLLTVGFTDLLSLSMAVSGILLCIALGIVGVYSPYFFEKYDRIWEKRLHNSVEIEKRLESLFEGNQNEG